MSSENIYYLKKKINPKLSNLLSKPSNISSEIKLIKHKSFNNPKNIENPFNEEEIVIEIYDKLRKKNYNELYQILDRLPKGQDINELLFKFFEELQKHDYTITQLLAISTLLYRLSNVNFVTVESPKPYPLHSIQSIANIIENKTLQKSKRFDEKIKEIVKNLISHYNIDIKRNNTDKFALKLQNILLSFIIEYTRPESNQPLFVESKLPLFKNEQNLRKYAKIHPEMMPRLVGSRTIY
jgi:hypothetical protein